MISLKDQLSGHIKIDGGNDTRDEFQEDQKSEMTLNDNSVLSHCVRHTFQDHCMLAWVDCRVVYVLDEWERLHCQGFIQVFLCDVLLYQLV